MKIWAHNAFLYGYLGPKLYTVWVFSPPKCVYRTPEAFGAFAIPLTQDLGIYLGSTVDRWKPLWALCIRHTRFNRQYNTPHVEPLDKVETCISHCAEPFVRYYDSTSSQALWPCSVYVSNWNAGAAVAGLSTKTWTEIFSPCGSGFLDLRELRLRPLSLNCWVVFDIQLSTVGPTNPKPPNP